jgi:hypothetical protein
MITLEELSSTIGGILNNRSSGMLMVMAQLAPSSAAESYTLRFMEGEMIDARTATRKGAEVAVALSTASAITQFRWFPLQAKSDNPRKPELERQELAALFNLGKSATAPSGSEKNAPARAMSGLTGKVAYERAINVFSNFYLGDTMGDLERVARKYPPDANPEIFLNQCVLMLEPFTGEIEAQRLLGL